MTTSRRPEALEYGLIESDLDQAKELSSAGWPAADGLTTAFPFPPFHLPQLPATIPSAPQRSFTVCPAASTSVGSDIYTRLGCRSAFSFSARKSTTDCQQPAGFFGPDACIGFRDSKQRPILPVHSISGWFSVNRRSAILRHHPVRQIGGWSHLRRVWRRSMGAFLRRPAPKGKRVALAAPTAGS